MSVVQRLVAGPGDMTAFSFGHFADLFVTNVLNGTVAGGGKPVFRGTVLRLLVRLFPHGDGLIVETTPRGAQVAHKFLGRSGSPPGAGALFGLAAAPHGSGVYYVDDATNFLRLLH